MHGVRSWDVGRCRRNGGPLVLEIVDWPSGASEILEDTIPMM